MSNDQPKLTPEPAGAGEGGLPGGASGAHE